MDFWDDDTLELTDFSNCGNFQISPFADGFIQGRLGLLKQPPQFNTPLAINEWLAGFKLGTVILNNNK